LLEYDSGTGVFKFSSCPTIFQCHIRIAFTGDYDNMSPASVSCFLINTRDTNTIYCNVTELVPSIEASRNGTFYFSFIVNGNDDPFVTDGFRFLGSCTDRLSISDWNINTTTLVVNDR
jgi:hypothetical protein